jgi:hypothetical protein
LIIGELHSSGHEAAPGARGSADGDSIRLLSAMRYPAFIMFAIDVEARFQTTAGASFLTTSRLVKWSGRHAKFQSVSHKVFEGYSVKGLDRHFGRVMRWMLFSVGAEFFLKGLCLARGVEIRRAEQKSVPHYPKFDIAKWLRVVRNDPNAAGTFPTTYFGTLNRLLKKRDGGSFIEQLARAAGAEQHEEALVIAAFHLLTYTIRNRDAHAYVPNVREEHFWLVKELFVPALNVLVDWIPNGSGKVLNHWRATHEDFIRSL